MRKFIFLILLAPISTFAQEMDQFVIASQGDFSESAEMSLSWTLGDLVTETAFIGEEALTQGFQQPFLEKPNEYRPELLIADESILIEEQRELSTQIAGSYEVNVFPNPSDGLFNVEILSEDDLYILEVQDASGKLVHQSQKSRSLNVLDLSTYENGLYILRVSNAELTKSSIFRIVKM